MQVYDVFYQIMTELTPKEVGRFVKIDRQTHDYGIRALEKYLKLCFQGVETLTVYDLKILHMKILRIESLSIPKNYFQLTYMQIKDSLCHNKGNFTSVIRDLNPLNILLRDLDVVIANVRCDVPLIICYIMLYFCNGDIVLTVMNLTMPGEPRVTADIIFEIVFRNLGVKKSERYIKDVISKLGFKNSF